jgi:CheY-like chemotaxis protein
MSKLGSLGAILGSSTMDERLSDGAWSLHGSAPVRLLLLEDDEEDAILLKRSLAKIPDAHFDVKWVTNGTEALEALATGWYDATFVDHNLGGASGVEFIRDATAAGCVTPLIMMTGQRDRTTDMVAMKAGAADFLVKGQTDPILLDRTLRYAITSARIREELRRGREQILGLEQIGRAAATLADDGAFWATLAESSGRALISDVIILGLVQDPSDGAHWRQMARSGNDPSTDLGASLHALADTALTGGPALDGPRNLVAVRLDGWRHPVILVSANGVRETTGDTLRQLATAVEPILQLRIAISENGHAGQARLSALCLAIDWAAARADVDGRSSAFTVLVLESLDEAIGSAQLAADIRTQAGILVAEVGPQTVGVVLEVDSVERSVAPGLDLVTTIAGTRLVLGGVSLIGPDLTAAAFERAAGALELARRLGPGNAVAA